MTMNGASRLGELQELLRSRLMIRRKKSEVVKELPPKTRMVIEFNLDGTESLLNQERRTWDEYEDDLAKMQAALELAKVDDDEAVYKKTADQFRKAMGEKFGELTKIRREVALAKVPAIIEAIREDMESLGCPKLLVFAHHREVLAKLYEPFKDTGVLVNGLTEMRERDRSVQRFQTDPTCGPFFGSIRACGTGLNLQAALVVGFAEEDWNPSKMSQAEDRAHRLGRAKGQENVLVKHWLLANSIDAKMIGQTIDKQAMIDAALDDEKLAMAELPVLFPKAPLNGTRRHLTDDGLLITTAQAAAIRRGIVLVTMLVEVNPVDKHVACGLSNCENLSGRKSSLGRKICKRYERYIGTELIEAMGV